MIKNKLLATFLILPPFLVCFVFGAAWFMSSMVIYPKPNCTKDHHVFCETPTERNLEFFNVSFTTEDGIVLKGWYIPEHKGSKKAIVLVHGHGGTRNEGLRYSKALHDAGFNQLLFDLRSIGNDEKNFASMGYHEQKDVKAAVDFLIKEKKMDSIGIFGFSMGAATSILSMEKDNRIQAGIFSSGYANTVDQLVESGRRMFGIPKFPLFDLSIKMANFRGNMELEKVVPENSIQNLSPRPIYIFHCDKDDFIDYSHAKRLFAAAKEPKKLWTANCNKHEHIWNSDIKKAEEIAIKFFMENLK